MSGIASKVTSNVGETL